jgi:hypothetical protein
MAIEFVCECGNRFSAQDNHAGRWAVCPVCHREFAFDTGPDAGAFEVLDAGPRRRPFWKDPIVVFGWVGPFVALAIFCLYRTAVPRVLDAIWPPNIPAPQREDRRRDRNASAVPKLLPEAEMPRHATSVMRMYVAQMLANNKVGSPWGQT